MLDELREIVATGQPKKLRWVDKVTGRQRFLLVNVQAASTVLRVQHLLNEEQLRQLLSLPLPRLLSAAYRLEHKL